MKEQQLANAKHKAQWTTTMETYVFPALGRMSVGQVTASDIIKILEPIWVAKPETAKRVLQRMRAIFDNAIVRGWRESDPCRGVVQSLGGTGHRDVQHHRALPYAQVQRFVYILRTCNSNQITKLAFEWLILTATRSSETRGGTWAEIDPLKALWVIPARRMKGGIDHIVPLSDRCLRILEEARGLTETGALIFPGRPIGARGKLVCAANRCLGETPTSAGRAPVQAMHLSDMTFTKVLRDLGLAEKATAHGFRTSFRTWATEVDATTS